MKKILKFILSLIYPDKCIFCGDIIPLNCEDKFVCNDCIETLPYYDSKTDTDKIKNFTAVFYYLGKVKNTIHRFKFRYHPEYSQKLGEFMEQKIRFMNITEYDCIVAVPMYYKKEKRRGFNQANLLAKELSKRTGIDLAENLLIRTKATKPQLELNHIQREENVKDAFKVINKGCFKGKRIILIDDIYTTGSTAKSCIDILKIDGADEVFVFTLSKTLNKKC